MHANLDTMRIPRLTLVLLALAGAQTDVLPATAQGAVRENQITEALAIGQTFWHDRNVQPCANPQISVVPAPGGPGIEADGAAELGGCHVWLRASLVRAAGREHRRRNWGGDSDRENLCATVVHELGHTAGLSHTPSGVMSPYGVVPWACRVWRRDLDRKAT